MKRRKFNKTILTSLGTIGISNLTFGNKFISKNNKKLGIALVGLGNYSTRRLAPALEETSMCELKAIVTGTPSKIPQWKKKYGLSDNQVYNYENFDSIVYNPEVDIVYVVLPNNMHKEYTIRAFKANKHVICEKPLALNAIEAEEMIKASKKLIKSYMLAIAFIMNLTIWKPLDCVVMKLLEKLNILRVDLVFALATQILGD